MARFDIELVKLYTSQALTDLVAENPCDGLVVQEMMLVTINGTKRRHTVRNREYCVQCFCVKESRIINNQINVTE